MALTKQKHPYEVLLRFNFGGDVPPGHLGEFVGGHLIEIEAIVDDATGELAAPVQVGMPRDIPSDMLRQYFGDRFAAFEKQHRKQVATLRTITQELSAERAKVAELTAQLAAVTDQAGV